MVMSAPAPTVTVGLFNSDTVDGVVSPVESNWIAPPPVLEKLALVSNVTALANVMVELYAVVERAAAERDRILAQRTALNDARSHGRSISCPQRPIGDCRSRPNTCSAKRHFE